jgi:NADPH:quinone reductase-like Zn-dependent oxidoreductase
MVEEPAVPEPGPGQVRIKVLATGTGFTDTMIRRGRYPDFKGPLPFTPGYEIVGVVENMGAGVSPSLQGETVADLCVVGHGQYAIGMLVGCGSQTMTVGGESLIAAGLGLARLKLWNAMSFLFNGRSAAFYSITARRSTHPEEFKADMATLFQLLRAGAIQPVVIGQLPLAAASEVHARIDKGLGGKIVLLPWSA